MGFSAVYYPPRPAIMTSVLFVYVNGGNILIEVYIADKMCPSTSCCQNNTFSSITSDGAYLTVAVNKIK